MVLCRQAVGEQLGVTVHWWVGWFPSKAACDEATHMYHGDCHKVLGSGNDAGWSPGMAVDLIWDGIRHAYDPRARDECNDAYRSAGWSHCEFVFEWVEGEPWIGSDPVFTTPAFESQDDCALWHNSHLAGFDALCGIEPGKFCPSPSLSKGWTAEKSITFPGSLRDCMVQCDLRNSHSRGQRDWM